VLHARAWPATRDWLATSHPVEAFDVAVVRGHVIGGKIAGWRGARLDGPDPPLREDCRDPEIAGSLPARQISIWAGTSEKAARSRGGSSRAAAALPARAVQLHADCRCQAFSFSLPLHSTSWTHAPGPPTSPSSGYWSSPSCSVVKRRGRILLPVGRGASLESRWV